MGRWWDEFVARVDDTVGLGLTVLLLFVAAALVAAGWYFWPRWLPTNWPYRGVKDVVSNHRSRTGLNLSYAIDVPLSATS